MRPLSAAELLTVRERGAGGSPAQRALLLLSAACDDLPEEGVRRLTIGQRDARLLALRERLFGSTLPCLAECPACHEPLAWNLDAGMIRTATMDPPATGEYAVRFQDYEMKFRLPNIGDLARLSPQADTAINHRRLLRGCLLAARCSDRAISADELPAGAAAALARRMAELDPQADVQLNLHCPQCGHAWPALFDIGSFLWTELQAWAARVLREVHELASAYGWTETEILALSPQRRQAYLDLVRA